MNKHHMIVLLLACTMLLFALSSCQEEVPCPTTNSTSGAGSTAVSGTTAPTVPVPTEPEHTEPEHTEPQPTETEPTEPLETEPPHEHSYEATVVAPTCLEQGYTTYLCVCGDSYTADITDATGHNWDAWVVVTEATEESTGLEQRSCLNCEAVETKIIPVIIPDHTHSFISEVTKSATCTEDGELTYTCSCGASYKETTPKTGHSYTSEVTDATCTEKGYTTYTCTACGHGYKDNYQDALGHNYTSHVTMPTCTADGYTTYTCSRCNSSYNDDVTPATGHSYTAKVTTEATCDADGVKTYTCSSCSDQYTESIAKLGHDYEAKVTAPTCTAKGYTTYTCSRCKDSYQDNYTDMTDHNYTCAVTLAPTCAKDGVRTYTCRCGAYYTESIAKTDHNYVDTVVQPTCTEDGYTEHNCSVCGHTYTDNTVPATGHVNTKTETADGYEIVTCVDCGAVISKTPTSTEHTHTYATKNLAETVAAQIAAGKIDMTRYASWFDWNVQACTECNYIKEDTIEFIYSDTEAATMMLGYVNELRGDVLGTKYTLELDATLVELAKIRAKEISVNFSHSGGTFTNADENIIGYGPNVYDQYKGWFDSEGHYKNMTSKSHQYFGYALYRCENTGSVYGVQLFWSAAEKIEYEYNPNNCTTFTIEVTPPSCTEDGYTTYTCVDCGKTQIKDIVPATGHQNTTTTIDDGYETVTCTDCGSVISKTPVSSSGHACAACGGACVIKNLADAVAADIAAGYFDFVQYADWFDYNAMVCSRCGLIDENTIAFAYTDMEAAAIMLGYVNELRTEVLGDKYTLELDATLVELAKIRAKEIATNYTHYSGTHTYALENICNSGPNIYDQFVAWKNSEGHYDNMNNITNEYFGYALYKVPNGTNIYGVQLFWSIPRKAEYEYNPH